MNAVLEEIYDTRRILRRDGTSVPFEYSISIDEGQAIQRMIREVKPHVTLEIGLAHGVSSVFMCEALEEVEGRRHIVIDPGQVEGWNEVGLYTIERAGYSSLIEFHNEPSHIVLPRLEAKGERVGVALIDGWHTFDYVLVDFFFVDRILEVGGYVMLDDTRWYPAIRKVARYVATHRSYVPVPNRETPFRPSRARRVFEAAASVLRQPPLRRIAQHLVRPDVLGPDSLLGLPPDNHIAFKKTSDDVLGDGRNGTRSWNQHVDF
jgi:predicted O-methyltransferase YrrM